MPTSDQPQFRVAKKVSKACERCRLMKVKCSGSQPCTRCERKKEQCVFVAESRRISVPESYLRELETRNSQVPTPTHSANSERLFRPGQQCAGGPSSATSRLTTTAQADLEVGTTVGYSAHLTQPPTESRERDTGEESIGNAFRQNPLADNDYTFARMGDRFFYMGPTSSWSFCGRVLALLGKRLPEASYAPDPGHLDGGAFKLRWRPLGLDEPVDVSNLPPLDYALFLFNTAEFYLGLIFYLIDEQAFLHRIHELYKDPVATATSYRHWYAQFLWILAYGKAFLVHRSPHEGPSGYQYAARAMALMPNLSGLAPDSISAVQALALASVYLQSIDMRVGALQHIGQALCICIIEGWHRHMPEEIVGIEHSRRCNIIFWVVYTLDREFGPLMGAPTSIRDEDITVKLPSEVDNSLDALNITLHVRLSRLMAQILTTVYGVGEQIGGSLVTNTQGVLRDLAKLSKDLHAFLDANFQGSISKASRMALRLILSYHHCVVLTTRPLVMCALKTHVERADTLRSGPLSLSPPVASLLQSCVDSAQAILRTLRVIGDEDLLEAFLPFQLEDAFSSAFVLHLLRAISPSLIQEDEWAENTRCTLDKMISKGNVVAPLRKLELSQLERTMAALTPLGDEPLMPSADLEDDNQENQSQLPATPLAVCEPGWDLFMMNDFIGKSPGEILNLAAQLEAESSFVGSVVW